MARARGGLTRLRERLDARLRTDKSEHLDDPSFPDDEKLFLVRYLHSFNKVSGNYAALARLLEPDAVVASTEGRRLRVLEVACGSGECSLALANDPRLDVTGSDIVPAYVERARVAASAQGNAARFDVIDALNLASRSPRTYDVVICANSLHHFTPDQLAALIAGAGHVASRAFIGVDGRRSLRLLAAIPFGAALTLRRWAFQDGLISARRFYSEPELREIARCAPGEATTGPAGLWWSALVVRFGEPPRRSRLRD